MRTRQQGRPFGILDQIDDLRLRIWVKRWGQVIEDCWARLNFFRDRLQYSASQESGLELLGKTYEKYLPSTLKTKAG
jgi:hypothetical protein